MSDTSAKIQEIITSMMSAPPTRGLRALWSMMRKAMARHPEQVEEYG
jgi:hypothetical protein